MITKLKKLVLVLTLCSFFTCTHVHDDQCHYDAKTGQGCTHQCFTISPINEKDPPA